MKRAAVPMTTLIARDRRPARQCPEPGTLWQMGKNMWARSSFLVGAVVAVLAAQSAAQAAINLVLRPLNQTVYVSDPVHLGLYAVSDSPGNQLMSAADVLFTWNPAYVELVGLDQSGATPLLWSLFPIVDPWGTINESIPPTDGEGLYQAYANLGSPVVATPAGTLLTTLQFSALAATGPGGTDIAIVATLGDGSATTVYGGTTPNFDVTGTLGTAHIVIRIPLPALCPDANCDGMVNNGDIDAFVEAITNSTQYALDYPGCPLSNSDANQDGFVNNGDIDAFISVITGGHGCGH